MAGGKVWAQQTDDKRFALVYNPIDIDEYRYPLIAISSDDGIIFDDMVLVQGEVPPRRFYGRWKDFGPCYVRGIVPGNGNPPGEDMWLTYSMNKEDMWVSRVPTPIRHSVTTAVSDDFDLLNPYGAIPDWNIYAPRWAPVNVIPSPSGEGMVLELTDEDPYDYARAIRVFKEGQEVRLEWEFTAAATGNGRLEMDVTDRYGNRPIRMLLDEERVLSYRAGHEKKILGKVNPGEWQKLTIQVTATPYGHFSLSWNGEKIGDNIPLTVAVKSIERLSFRTGPYRDLPGRKTPNEDPVPPLPGADEKDPLARFLIDNVKITP